MSRVPEIFHLSAKSDRRKTADEEDWAGLESGAEVQCDPRAYSRNRTLCQVPEARDKTRVFTLGQHGTRAGAQQEDFLAGGQK